MSDAFDPKYRWRAARAAMRARGYDKLATEPGGGFMPAHGAGTRRAAVGAWMRGRGAALGALAPRSIGARRALTFCCAALLLLAVVTPSWVSHYTALYQTDSKLAKDGAHHLLTAEKLLKGLQATQIDVTQVAKARGEFDAATENFQAVARDLDGLPTGAAQAPVYGATVQAAQHFLPLALAVAQMGALGCDALGAIAPDLRNPLSAVGPGLSQRDLDTLDTKDAQINALLAGAVARLKQLTPDDLRVVAHAGFDTRMLTTDLPLLAQEMTTLTQALRVAPLVLGVGAPANYLIEQLDSSELRPGGGFIGTYGIATLGDAQLRNIMMTDVDLLDRPFEAAGGKIAFPPQYTWFSSLVPNWSLRDSNLDADFPTSARNAEQLYATEGGTEPLQGVIAITPWFIERLLTITGPIYVAEYHETIDAQNLVDRIHYHQLRAQEGRDDVPSPDGHSSLRKRFTSYLFQHFLERLKALGPTATPKVAQALMDSLRDKDAQVYINAPAAETLLSDAHLAATLDAPPGDGLFVVDTNVTGSKSNHFINATLDDQVTLDASGVAQHHTTLTYAWPESQASRENDYGNIYQYLDYIRIYVPSGSALRGQRGWAAEPVTQAFNRTVWAGRFKLNYGQTASITLDWTSPHAAVRAGAGWRYSSTIQRQAGAVWTLNVQVTTAASCAVTTGTAVGLRASGGQRAATSIALTMDTALGLGYSCAHT